MFAISNQITQVIFASASILEVTDLFELIQKNPNLLEDLQKIKSEGDLWELIDTFPYPHRNKEEIYNKFIDLKCYGQNLLEDDEFLTYNCFDCSYSNSDTGYRTVPEQETTEAYDLAVDISELFCK